MTNVLLRVAAEIPCRHCDLESQYIFYVIHGELETLSDTRE